MAGKVPGAFFAAVGFAVLNMVVAILLSGSESLAWIAGYLLGLFAVAIHLVTSLFTRNSTEKQFITVYYFGVFVRFLIVLILFALFLILVNFDEFSFTVSFIISYLFHSVNEVILLNRKFSN